MTDSRLLPPNEVITKEGHFVFDTPEQAEEYKKSYAEWARQEYRGNEPREPAPRTQRDVVTDSLLGAGRGAVKGLTWPVEIGYHVLNKATMAGDDAGFFPEFMAPSNLLNELVPRPETGAGRYSESIAEGVTGSLPFPGNKILNAVIGGAGGAGGELASNTLGEGPVERVSGSLLASLMAYPAYSALRTAGTFLGAPSTQTPRLISEAAKEIGPDDWAKAVELQKQAQSNNVKLTPIQAIEKPTPLMGLQERVTASGPGGAKMTEFLGQQNEDALQAGKNILPGAATDPVEAAARAKAAAGEAVATAKNMRTDAVRRDYEILPQPFSNESVGQAYRQTQRMVMSDLIGESTAAGQFIRREVLGKIHPNWTGTTHGEQIKTILMEAKDKLRNRDYLKTTGVSDHAVSNIKSGLAPLENYLRSISLNRVRGDVRYGNITETLVDPLRRGPVGQLRGPKNQLDEAMANRVLGVLDSDNITAQSIMRTQQWLSHQDPGAFSTLVKTFIERRLQDTFKGKGGVSDPTSPAKFAEALWGSPQQPGRRENFRAMMVSAARDAGLPEGEVLRGAENMMRVMEAAGRAKGGMAQGIPSVQGGAENVLVRGGPGAGSGIQIRFFQGIDDMLRNRAFGDIAEILTSPDGMKKLRQLAKWDISKIRLGAAGSAGADAFMQGGHENAF